MCHSELAVLIFLQVNSFTERKLYTWCFLILGAGGSIHLHNSIPWRSRLPVFVCIACWFLSTFTLMPAEIPDNNQLVYVTDSVLSAMSRFMFDFV